jgi:DNA-binding response OmpR family regulator
MVFDESLQLMGSESGNNAAPASVPKLLIVDDDAHVLDSLQDVLEDEYAVSVCDQANNTLELMRQLNPHLLLVDHRLGLIDGQEVVRQVRAEFPLVPIIMITGFATKELAINSVNLGLNGFLEKPIDLNQLKSQILSALNHVQTTQTLGYMRFDHPRMEVSIFDQKARLTKTEFNILKYLFDHRGNCISREELQLSVWGTSLVTKNTLDTHLTNLRKKLPILRDLIKAPIGIGFIFDDKHLEQESSLLK